MATEFILKAVTPEGLVFEKPVTFVKLRTENGDIGILAKHINFISPIGAGEMVVRENDKEEVTYYLEGGFLEVRQDKVVILGETLVESTKAEAVKRARIAAIEIAKKHKIQEERDILGTKKRLQSNLTRK
ncbi:ATP synthase F1 subunit epsilon [Leptotrichia sp. oral taxon 218]|jgi:ATP synthase F1, epsilon subunit|uniref:ATP synthase epsilon chain n=1 Tax=Leptotrichia rugosa TaxID=3239302 RepID=A0AB39VEJ8_9FUSO|nr:ATP synthase F1 subunit epsilon [Leptotrichia sp. oral taxon 218]QUB94760.1 ATP synthase F1 subunit epsilon [Leptotrichia sp. oral taxon 218]